MKKMTERQAEMVQAVREGRIIHLTKKQFEFVKSVLATEDIYVTGIPVGKNKISAYGVIDHKAIEVNEFVK